MWRYVVRRVIWSIPVILLLMFTVFALMRALPGGPFDFAGDKSLSKAVTDNLERRYHLDWPQSWQFVSYVVGDDITGAVCEAASALPGCDKVLGQLPDGRLQRRHPRRSGHGHAAAWAHRQRDYRRVVPHFAATRTDGHHVWPGARHSTRYNCRAAPELRWSTIRLALSPCWDCRYPASCWARS